MLQAFWVLSSSGQPPLQPPGVKEIDIAATLEHVRDQRPGLVRSKVTVPLFLDRSCQPMDSQEESPFSQVTSPAPPPKSAPGAQAEVGAPRHHPPTALPQDQFEFALTAVAEEVNAILKALPQ